MIRFLMLLLVVFFSGCASLSGNAMYRYERQTIEGAKCSLIVDSGRTVQGGVSMSLGDNCELQVQANGVGQGQSSVPDLNGLLDRLMLLQAAPARPSPPPSTPTPLGFGIATPPDG